MFNEKLKAARKRRYLSQTELGKLIGVQTQTISNWENSKSKPNLETINKLCEALDVPLRYFISEEHVDYQLTLEEAFVINKYRELNDDGKSIVINLLKTM